MTETTTALDETQVANLDDQTADIVIQARECVVKDDAGLAVASTLLGGIKALLAESASIFDEPQSAAHAAHKAIIAARKKVDDPLKRAEKSVKIAVSNHHAEIYRRQEKARLAAEAEARRLEEARIKAEREEIRAEAKRIADEEARLAAAIEAEELGDMETADAILEAEPEIIAPALIELPPAPSISRVAPPAKVAGMSTSKKYTAAVRDLRVFVQWALFCDRFEEFFSVNQSALNATAREAKESFDISGCKLHTETVVTSRKV
jgi:hypothetical protein